MDIVFHAHRAIVSPSMRRRAESMLRRVARRAPRALDATVRFIQDGPTRCVELALHSASGRRYVARAESRYFGPALADAAHRLAMQVDHTKRTPKARGGGRRSARARIA